MVVVRSFYKIKPYNISYPLVGREGSRKKNPCYFSGCGGRTKKLILGECELRKKGITIENEFG